MGRPASQHQASARVQQHDEARGEAGRHGASPGAHGQAADQPRAHVVVGQPELVLTGTETSGITLTGATPAKQCNYMAYK